MGKPHVVVLGGGPAGVGAAYKLRQSDRATVTLVERNEGFGGNAGSFEACGQHLDYGSHRLHSACHANILADIQRLLAGDLADRPRNGRIRLRGKWVKFPLQAKDLFLSLDKRFAFGAATDMARGALPGQKDPGDTFASVLEANLGPTICKHFYFPYARKMWGREPEVLSDIQAYKRVSSGTFAKLVKKVLKPPGAGRFYYPKEGYGQISSAFARAAKDAGAELLTSTEVSALKRPTEGGGRWTVEVKTGDEARSIEADQVWSTIPVTLATKMMSPAAPHTITDAIDQIDYRAMVLVYAQFDVQQFHATDAHYFPEENVKMTRLSEPKNYYGHTAPNGSTVLCAEIPCDLGDALWTMSDEDLGKLLVEDMARADLFVPHPPKHVFTKRLPQAYPIYLKGYDRPLSALDQFVSDLDGFLTFGRQGLFAHDNLHHALFMAYCAVECVSDRGFDRTKWGEFREVFKGHVVED